MGQTLDSVASQTRDDWQFMGVYDKSDDEGAIKLWNWCDRDPMRRNFLLNVEHQLFAPRNQYEGLQRLGVEDDDIVIWLDMDGDMLAHPDVLQRVAEAYDDGVTLLTYGTYRAVPDPGTPPPITYYPADVVANNGYRQDALYNGPRFNHLRTMKGKVVNSIPLQSFQWRQRPGDWYMSGADYLWMISGLERAGGRYKLLDEVLLVYNDANPFADNKMHMHETSACDIDFLGGVPLAAL